MTAKSEADRSIKSMRQSFDLDLRSQLDSRQVRIIYFEKLMYPLGCRESAESPTSSQSKVGKRSSISSIEDEICYRRAHQNQTGNTSCMYPFNPTDV